MAQVMSVIMPQVIVMITGVVMVVIGNSAPILALMVNVLVLQVRNAASYLRGVTNV